MGGGDHGHGHGPKIVHRPVIDHPIDSPHGHPAEFKAPDWRMYKVENAPRLQEIEKRLAAKGLKDPWLRNHVWRYDANFGYIHPVRQFFKSWGRGMRNGIILAAGVILLQTAYGKMFNSKKHHGHGDAAHH